MLRKKRGIYLLLLSLCWFSLVEAQNSASARPDSNLAETGNPFRIHLSVPVSEGEPAGIDFSAWDTIMPTENVLNQAGWELDNQQWVNHLTLIAFDEDTLQLPPLGILIKGKNAVYTNPVTIEVLATPAPLQVSDIADIKDIHREPVKWTDYLPWIIGTAIVLGLIGLLYWWFGRKTKKAALSRVIELPAHELALRKLAQLRQKNYPAQGNVKAYYENLTFILREYLQKRFAVPALESTSDEIMRDLRQSGLFPEHLENDLRDTLQQADLAKFAKWTPEAGFHDQAFNLVRTIVEQTQPEQLS